MNPKNPSEEPRYGRRSDAWTPDSSVPQTQSESSPAATPPWPQYGQLSREGEAPASSGSHVQPTGETPYASPASHAPYGVPPHAVPVVPGRGAGIGMLIGGLVTMLLIAPLVVIILLSSGLNLSELVNSSTPVTSGQTVTLSDEGSYTIVANSSTVYSCSLTSASGQVHEMTYYASTSPTFWAQGLTPGDYTLNCAMEGTADLVGIGGLSIDESTAAVLSAFGWATVVGVVGLVLTVWGIVKIVRVNARRREIQRMSGIS